MGCGNTKRFKMIRDWDLTAETEDTWDCEDEQWVEEGRPEDNVTDGTVNDARDIECDSCGSTDIEEDLDEEELLEMKVLHTDKEGNWSEDELEEDEQNDELKAELVGKKL